MKRPWTLLACTLLVSCLPLQQVSSHPSARDQLSSRRWNPQLAAAIQARLQQTTLPVQGVSQRHVLRHIRSYLSTGRRSTERMLRRSRQYFPIFEHYLRRQGLPLMLKYLPMVESRLLTRAESDAGAAGLWQFMPGTAEAYGLQIDDWKDERLDPYRASEAAARLIADLYAEFGDWALALAAYNCGPGRVRKAIRKAGSRRPAEVMPYLPRQTRRYLPQLIAAYYIGEFSGFHSLIQDGPPDETTDLRMVEVDRKLSFRQITTVTGLPHSQITQWNPSLLRQYVPGHLSDCRLLLPRRAALGLRRFLRQKDNFPPFASAGLIPTVYKVASGDRIEDLACLFDCTVEEIMDWNALAIPVLAANQQLELRLASSFWLRLV